MDSAWPAILELEKRLDLLEARTRDGVHICRLIKAWQLAKQSTL